MFFCTGNGGRTRRQTTRRGSPPPRNGEEEKQKPTESCITFICYHIKAKHGKAKQSKKRKRLGPRPRFV